MPWRPRGTASRGRRRLLRTFSTAIASGRKRRGEGHTRREEILQAAKELFLEQGYDATTIRRIADRVGISAPALYLYFNDKEALILALCDQTFAHLIDTIGEIEKTVHDLSGARPPLRRCLCALRPQPSRRIPPRVPGRQHSRIDPQGRPSREPLTIRTARGGGAIVFGRLVAMLSQAEASGIKLNYPPDTCAELCWMGNARPGRRLHLEARLPLVES